MLCPGFVGCNFQMLQRFHTITQSDATPPPITVQYTQLQTQIICQSMLAYFSLWYTLSTHRIRYLSHSCTFHFWRHSAVKRSYLNNSVLGVAPTTCSFISLGRSLRSPGDELQCLPYQAVEIASPAVEQDTVVYKICMPKCIYFILTYSNSHLGTWLIPNM